MEREPVVLVAGASRGLGRSIAEALCRRGVRLALAARTQAGLAACPGALAVPTDLADPAARQRLVEATLAHFGRVDGLVYAARSCGTPAGLAELTPEKLRAAAEVDFFAPVELVRLLHPAMMEGVKAGRTPKIRLVGRDGSGYDAGGHRALVGLVQAARIEFARYDIDLALVPEARALKVIPKTWG